jgi:uncharacterized protein YicC (UPF0701 family)
MELLLLKAQETAHLANDMFNKVNDFSCTLNEQIKINEGILTEAVKLANELLPELDETGEKKLSRLLRLIEILIVHRITNYKEALEILEWSSKMAGKYANEYKRLIENYGYDLN